MVSCPHFLVGKLLNESECVCSVCLLYQGNGYVGGKAFTYKISVPDMI